MYDGMTIKDLIAMVYGGTNGIRSDGDHQKSEGPVASAAGREVPRNVQLTDFPQSGDAGRSGGLPARDEVKPGTDKTAGTDWFHFLNDKGDMRAPDEYEPDDPEFDS